MHQKWNFYQEFLIANRNLHNNHYKYRTLSDSSSMLNSNLHAHQESITYLYVDQDYIYSADSYFFKVWNRRNRSLIKAYRYTEAFVVHHMVRHKNRLYVHYSGCVSSMHCIKIYDLKDNPWQTINTCIIRHTDLSFKIFQDLLYLLSKDDEVIIWDLEGNYLGTLDTQDLDQHTLENLKERDQHTLENLQNQERDQQHFYFYPILKLEQAFLLIQNTKTKKTIQTIAPTNNYALFSQTSINCFYFFNGCIYIGLSDGQIKIYEFNIPPPDSVISYLDIWMSRLFS